MPGLPTSSCEPSRKVDRNRPLSGRRGPALLAVAVVAGCASAQTVATDLDLGAVVSGDRPADQLTRAGQDDLSLRADGSVDGGAGGGIGPVAAAPQGSPAGSPTSAPAAPRIAPPPVAPPDVGATAPTAATATTADPPPSGPVTDGAATASTHPPDQTHGSSSSTVPVTTVQAPVAAPSTTATVPPPPATDSPEGLAQGEARSEGLLSELRTSVAASPLTRDPELDAVAREWSRHMAETGVFDHSASPYGENIAFTSNVRLTAAEAAQVFHRLWTESEVHYDNMTGGYAKVGIGLYRTERGWYGTHVFSY